MTATVKSLPQFKIGATPAERLYELARMAEEHPERLERFVVIYEGAVTNEERSLGRIEVGYTWTRDVISALEVGKAYYLKELLTP